MHFTIRSSVEGCEGLLKGPVFLLKIGFFIGLVRKMNQGFNLKLFLSISLGLHFFVFCFLSLLLPELKITKLPLLNLEVSLLPMIKEEREVKNSVQNDLSWSSRIEKPFPTGMPRQKEEERLEDVAKQETEIKNEPLPVPHEEKKIPQIKKVEDVPSTKEQVPLLTPAVQTEVKMVSISEPKPSLLESGKKEMEGRQTERIIVASLGPTVPQTNPPEKPDMAMKSPSLSESEIIFAQPRYAENPKPLYPREAKKRGYEGEVLLRVEVLSNGRVGEIEVKRSSGHEELDRSALATVKQWKFIPARKGDTPVPVWVNIPVAFQLR